MKPDKVTARMWAYDEAVSGLRQYEPDDDIDGVTKELQMRECEALAKIIENHGKRWYMNVVIDNEPNNQKHGG
jgi:ribosome-binding ATPase YchF (GTP1/OBG family)